MTIGRAKLAGEAKKLVRFLVVGVSTFLIQAILYYLFSRWLFVDLQRTVSYLLAMVYSVAFNYSLNRVWTFSAQPMAKGSAKRYVKVAGAASALSGVLFWLGHDILRLFDLYLVVFVNMIVPCFTFVMHRIYTFHDEPGRALKRFVR